MPWIWGPKQPFTKLLKGWQDHQYILWWLQQILNIDASGDGRGIALYQEHDDSEHIVAYVSGTLHASEYNYLIHTTRIFGIAMGSTQQIPYMKINFKLK